MWLRLWLRLVETVAETVTGTWLRLWSVIERHYDKGKTERNYEGKDCCLSYLSLLSKAKNGQEKI
jgi:hypothetical protein